jgi:hypothetical protein
MADEIKVLVDVKYANGNAKDTFNPGNINITQTTVGKHAPIVIVNTSAWEAVPFGDLATPRIMAGRNLDASNFVSVAMTTSVASTAAGPPFAKLKAGDPFVIPPSTSASFMKWKADTGAVKVDLRAYEL